MPLPLRRRALLTPALGALVLAGLVTAPAQAATVTATGVRCTVVGTPGSDILRGTSGRDVICGRGGADVIRAGGGNDLVDAGAGNDRVVAGDGTDRVLGGTGTDVLVGGTGADRLTGGAGADQVEGDDGADTLSGGDGTDTLQGDGGSDTVSGGGQDDVIDGGGQGDDLTGGGGDDDLTGGGGVDQVDGGSGDNVCIVDAQDESVRCRYDEEAPAIVETAVEPGTVDVTKDAAVVTVRVHATDDTGVRSVVVHLSDRHNGTDLGGDWLDQTSGTERDGWWEGTITVPQWTAPGALYPDVTVTDRQRRVTSDYTGPAALQVTDNDPDLQGPQMTLTEVSPTAIDVRRAARNVRVTVHATDPQSGISTIQICIDQPGTATKYNTFPLFASVDCQDPTLVSGSVRDGVWTSTLTVPQGRVGATYNVEINAQDQVSNDVRWYGPEAYQQWTDGHWCCTDAFLFADDAGRVQVTGTVADATPAWIDEVTASKTQLDTLPGDDTIHVRVHALDATGEGEGVTSVTAELVSDGSLASDPGFDQAGLQLTSGTVTDGWWEGDVVAPQGTPPGTYHLLVGVGDRAHGTLYTDPAGPLADGVTYQPLDGIPTVTIVNSRS